MSANTLGDFSMDILYATMGSGNCYKAQLVMAQLGIRYDTVMIDVLSGETRSPEYLAINPNGTVPFLKLADGRTIAESNAMIWYLAEGSPLFPADPFDQALALQWMIYEQTKLEPNISPARFFTTIVPSKRDEMASKIKQWQEEGAKALQHLNDYLKRNDFIAGKSYTIADVAVFGYTHVADEGGFQLNHFPAVQAWMNRVASSDGYVPMHELSAAA